MGWGVAGSVSGVCLKPTSVIFARVIGCDWVSYWVSYWVLVDYPTRPRRTFPMFAREHGRVTMADAVKLAEANRKTLKQHFRNLVARRHLQQRESGRGVWYELG